jgi:uncharacterized protein (DUF4415 family)
MSARRTVKPSRKPTRGRADFERLDRMTEAEIERTSPPELANLPADFWKDAVLVVPESKVPISLRVDRDVLEWFRQEGPRYQNECRAPFFHGAVVAAPTQSETQVTRVGAKDLHWPKQILRFAHDDSVNAEGR